jgi:hypothetical protein
VSSGPEFACVHHDHVTLRHRDTEKSWHFWLGASLPVPHRAAVRGGNPALGCRASAARHGSEVHPRGDWRRTWCGSRRVHRPVRSAGPCGVGSSMSKQGGSRGGARRRPCLASPERAPPAIPSRRARARPTAGGRLRSDEGRWRVRWSSRITRCASRIAIRQESPSPPFSDSLFPITCLGLVGFPRAIACSGNRRAV